MCLLIVVGLENIFTDDEHFSSSVHLGYFFDPHKPLLLESPFYIWIYFKFD